MSKDLEKVYQKLRQLKIQGATAIAQTIAQLLGDYSREGKSDAEIKEAAAYLLSARPTEAMAQNGVRFILSSLKGVSGSVQREKIQNKSENFLQFIRQGKEQLAQSGIEVLRSAQVVFTHCRSSSVEGILKEGKKKGFSFQVVNTETRPLFQGRIAARNLLRAGIPVQMAVDAAGPFILSSFSEEIDFLLLGSDAVLTDGSAVNKIGSYGLSLAAFEAGIPLYIAASLLKYHPHSEIELEQRPREEIWPSAPDELEIVNLAFDCIPASYIKGFITEKGVIKPKDFSRQALKLYPWLNARKI